MHHASERSVAARAHDEQVNVSAKTRKLFPGPAVGNIAVYIGQCADLGLLLLGEALDDLRPVGRSPAADRGMGCRERTNRAFIFALSRVATWRARASAHSLSGDPSFELFRATVAIETAVAIGAQHAINCGFLPGRSRASD